MTDPSAEVTQAVAALRAAEAHALQRPLPDAPLPDDVRAPQMEELAAAVRAASARVLTLRPLPAAPQWPAPQVRLRTPSLRSLVAPAALGVAACAAVLLVRTRDPDSDGVVGAGRAAAEQRMALQLGVVAVSDTPRTFTLGGGEVTLQPGSRIVVDSIDGAAVAMTLRAGELVARMPHPVPRVQVSAAHAAALLDGGSLRVRLDRAGFLEVEGTPGQITLRAPDGSTRAHTGGLVQVPLEAPAPAPVPSLSAPHSAPAIAARTPAPAVPQRVSTQSDPAASAAALDAGVAVKPEDPAPAVASVAVAPAAAPAAPWEPAVVAAAQGKHTAAQAALRAAGVDSVAAAAPVDVVFELATSARLSGDAALAHQLLDVVVQRAPGTGTALRAEFFLARTALDSGDDVAARAALRRVRDAGARTPYARESAQRLALWALAHAGAPQSATDLRALLQIDPQSPLAGAAHAALKSAP